MVQVHKHCTASLQLGKAPRVSRKREGGTIAIMFVGMMVVILAALGGALDLSRVYNRKFEVQTIADMAALAAARELDGTSAGLLNASAAAQRVIEGSPLISSQGLRYQYNNAPISWSDSAISFSATSSRDGSWLSAGTAGGSAQSMFYVKVDTAGLSADLGQVEMTFLRIFNPEPGAFDVTSSAVAGKSSINVTPLAICAISDVANAARGTELVQYGFRRGISYDLMQLNPGGSTPENFLVDPIAMPGGSSASINTLTSTVAPFVCAGSMAVPKLAGGLINVQRPFPLANLFQQLNSRFDLYYTGSVCDVHAAPPDTNTRGYTYSTYVTWMTAPDTQVAKSTVFSGTLYGKTFTNALLTVADPMSAPSGTTAKNFGPLWVYAKAVPYSSYVPGSLEPAGGYTPFGTGAWSSLYSPTPTLGTYPSQGKTPYSANLNATFPAPARRPGVVDRRVLNVPLLQCPVAAGTSAQARILGIGRFFMTVPATNISIPAEFAGAYPVEAVKGQVELYP